MIAVSKIFENAKIFLSRTLEDNLANFLDFYRRSFDFEFDFNQLQASRSGETNLILVDSSDYSHLKKFDAEFKNVLIFDHHASSELKNPNEKFIIKKNSGACVSLILEHLLEKNLDFKKIFSREEILLFLLGIYSDTGELKFPTTTDLDKKIAERLFSTSDITTSEIQKFLTIPLTKNQKFFYNKALEKQKICELGDVKISFIAIELKFDPGNFAPVINEYQNNVSVDACFFIVKRRNKTYIMARSKDDKISVLETIQKFGGGGHKTAAGAAFFNEELTKTFENVEKIFFEQVLELQFLNFFMKNKNFENFRLEKDMVFKKLESSVFEGNNLNYDESIFFYNKVDINEKIILKDFLEKPEILDINNIFFIYDDDQNLQNIIERPEILKFLEKIKSKKVFYKFFEVTYVDGFSLAEASKKTALIVHFFYKLINLADKENLKIFFVGGLVRDFLLNFFKNRENYKETNSTFLLKKIIELSDKDFDITLYSENFETDGKDAIYFAKVLQKHFDEENSIFCLKSRLNEAFKTANLNISIKNSDFSFNLDLATVRSEKYQKSGALPIVASTSSLETDAKRRDITINSIMFCLNKNNFGEIVDFYNGISDLEKQKIRLNYSLSLVDDPTRIFRIFRFLVRFGFNFDEKTEKILNNAIKNKVLKNISKNRILSELKKSFSEELNFDFKNLQFLDNYEILKFLFEEVFAKSENFSLDLDFFKNLNLLNFYLSIYDFVYEKWFVYFLGLVKNFSFDSRREIVNIFLKTQAKDLVENMEFFYRNPDLKVGNLEVLLRGEMSKNFSNEFCVFIFASQKTLIV